jgi:hypothetical protein
MIGKVVNKVRAKYGSEIKKMKEIILPFMNMEWTH